MPTYKEMCVYIMLSTYTETYTCIFVPALPVHFKENPPATNLISRKHATAYVTLLED